MKGNRKMLQRMTERLDLPAEPIPGQPLVEIAGDNRVLIENHYGVCEYSLERIGIKVKFGAVVVCGAGLKLRRMSKEQLVISGRIDSIAVRRRERG